MRILGVDGGIASVGWAVIEVGDDGGVATGDIVAAGVRTFDKPETDRERTPTNAIRRGKRLARRTLRRRRQRMAELRSLFHEHGMLPNAERDALHAPPVSPWTLRADALDRLLAPAELATALGHIARHRGFWSNSKRDRGRNADPDTSKMLSTVQTTSARAAQHRTVGAMLARDPEYATRKRNRAGDYGRTLLRDDLRQEVRTIFLEQRRRGSACASAALQARFEAVAFHQRPLQDHEDKVGVCPFEPPRKRTSRHAYSFELFRLLSRLNNLTLVAGGEARSLSPDELAKVVGDFGISPGITYKAVRKTLDLSPATRFSDVAPDDEVRDVTSRSGKAAEGTYALRSALDGAWTALRATPERLDRVAEVLAFRESFDSIRAGLVEAGLEPLLVDAVMHAAEAGRFEKFARASHISAAAARAINPHLARGLKYSDACAEAGYDHTARPATTLADIGSPVARKALSEMLKQVRAVVQRHGIPDQIHVELARDVGKGGEERDRMTRGIEKRNAEKDRRRADFADLLGRPPTGAEELLRYELWCEQNARCLYSDEAIPPSALVASDNVVQVDHILPWSRFGDDSFANKTLCFARANQHKRGRTPFEWFSAERSVDWPLFERRVDGCLSMKGRKKRGFYLRQNAPEVETRFRERNLNDTRIASRLLLDALKRLYPSCTFGARPGAMTSKLRRAWGVEFLKKDAAGKRLADDRHHALDAIVLAATTEAMLRRLTDAFQEAERRGLPRDFGHVDEPWPGFRAQAIAATEAVFVSRAERHRARGEAHAATIKQVRMRDGRQVVFERRDIFALKPADLAQLKDPERNQWLVRALQEWFDAGRPKDRLPRSPNDDEIRKVRLKSTDKVAVSVREGTADRGDMVRVDVFRDDNGRGRFLLVPVYPHQIASFQRPPVRAVVAHKSEGEWVVVAPSDFLFSLQVNCLVDIEKPDGETIRLFSGHESLDGSAASLAAP